MKVFKKRLALFAVVGVCVLISLSALSWVLIGSIGYWLKLGWLPAETSGWAQFGGGLLAVVVAIWVPYDQNRRAQQDLRLREQSERLNSILAALALAKHIFKVNLELSSEAMGFRINDPSRNVQRQAAAHNAVQAASMLREIPVTEFSTEMVEAVVKLREIAGYGEYAGGQLTSFIGLTWGSTGVHTQLNDNLRELKSLVAHLESLATVSTPSEP